MSLISYKRGQGSIVLRCKILSSAVDTGAGLTGLAYNSSGLLIGTICDNESTSTVYSTASNTIETITTLGTYATPTATKCRFKEVDSTNHKGIYEIQLADARFNSGKSVMISVSGAANAVETDLVIPLIDDDPYVAKPSNFASFVIDGSGRVDVSKIAGTSQTARDLGSSVLLSSGTGTGQVSLSSGTVTVGTNNDKTGYSLSGAAIQAIWDALTSALTTASSIGKLLVDNINATISSRSTYSGADTSGTTTLLSRIGSTINITSGKVDATVAGYASGQDPATSVLDATASSHNSAGTVGNKINSAASAGDPWTTSVPGSYGTGTAGYLLGNNLDAKISDVKSKTDNLPSSPANETTVAAVKSKTDNLPSSPAAVGSAMTLDLSQAVPTTNTAQTIGDALNAARAQGFGKWSIDTTSKKLTLYAADNNTPVWVFTLDSATAPKKRTGATP